MWIDLQFFLWIIFVNAIQCSFFLLRFDNQCENSVVLDIPLIILLTLWSIKCRISFHFSFCVIFCFVLFFFIFCVPFSSFYFNSNSIQTIINSVIWLVFTLQTLENEWLKNVFNIFFSLFSLFFVVVVALVWKCVECFSLLL